MQKNPTDETHILQKKPILLEGSTMPLTSQPPHVHIVYIYTVEEITHVYIHVYLVYTYIRNSIYHHSVYI